jgi:hypothetical protein
MGEGSDGDAVWAGRCHRSYVLQRDASWHFNDCSPLDQPDGVTDSRRVHVIQQNDVGLPCNGLPHFRQGFHFHDKIHAAWRMSFGLAAGSQDCPGPSVEESQMIIFDQDAVAEGLTMICASAEEDCPFLKRSYARDCLSRVQDSHGDAWEVLEKIQGHSFSPQDGSSIAFDLKETVSILCVFSLLAVEGEHEGRIHGSKGLHGGGKAGDYQRLLGDDARARRCGRGKERGRRNVAEGKVFLESQPNGASYVSYRRSDHRLLPQHGAQLSLAAGEHRVIAVQSCKTILVIGNDLRWSLGGKLLIAQFPFQP